MDKQRIFDLLEAKKAELEELKTLKCAKNVEHIELKRKADAALKAGDIESVLDIRSEIRRVDEEIASADARYNEAVKEHLNIMEAWEEYRREYEETYKKAVLKLEKAREALKKAFFDVLEPQNDALRVADAMKAAGLDPGQLQSMLCRYDVKRLLRVSYNNPGDYPEAAFLYSVGLLERDEVVSVRAVTGARAFAHHVDGWEKHGFAKTLSYSVPV